jgi:hypothetical protein
MTSGFACLKRFFNAGRVYGEVEKVQIDNEEQRTAEAQSAPRGRREGPELCALSAISAAPR